MADPWQPESYRINLPSWAQASPGLVQGYERAEQMRAARGLLTGKQPESWMQRAIMSDPANWMTGGAPQSQGWQSIYGIPDSTPSRVKPEVKPPAPGQGAPAPHVAPPERARREAVTAMAQQYAPQNYWESETGKALAAAAQSAGESALAARKSGPLADVADTSNPASQAYWDRADIQAWAGANKGLAASLRRKHGLPEDFTARIPVVQPASEFAFTPEQRAAAEAGYAGVTVDPSAAAAMGTVNPGVFSKSDVFSAPPYSVSDQALSAPAAPGTTSAQMNFSEPYLNPNEIRDVNLSGNDALQRAASGQAAKTGSTPMATSEAQRQVAESGYGGVKDPLLNRYLGMARVQNTSFPR